MSADWNVFWKIDNPLALLWLKNIEYSSINYRDKKHYPRAYPNKLHSHLMLVFQKQTSGG